MFFYFNELLPKRPAVPVLALELVPVFPKPNKLPEPVDWAGWEGWWLTPKPPKLFEVEAEEAGWPKLKKKPF